MPDGKLEVVVVVEVILWSLLIWWLFGLLIWWCWRTQLIHWQTVHALWCLNWGRGSIHKVRTKPREPHFMWLSNLWKSHMALVNQNISPASLEVQTDLVLYPYTKIKVHDAQVFHVKTKIHTPFFMHLYPSHGKCPLPLLSNILKRCYQNQIP